MDTSDASASTASDAVSRSTPSTPTTPSLSAKATILPASDASSDEASVLLFVTFLTSFRFAKPISARSPPPFAIRTPWLTCRYPSSAGSVGTRSPRLTMRMLSVTNSSYSSQNPRFPTLGDPKLTIVVVTPRWRFPLFTDLTKSSANSVASAPPREWPVTNTCHPFFLSSSVPPVSSPPDALSETETQSSTAANTLARTESYAALKPPCTRTSLSAPEVSPEVSSRLEVSSLLAVVSPPSPAALSTFTS
mmetsp:Transcript_4839/g.17871  ORF Transcript_4839/g.17871 Transcript_4839/m.17871 type:complete len:249 (+) Transcript_4839:634-1380(+)